MKLLLALLLALPALAQAEAPIQLLTTGNGFHGNETEHAKNGAKWTAITATPEGSTATLVKISVTTVEDAISDPEGGPYSGKDIIIEPEPIFLLKGLKVPTGPLSTSTTSATQLVPNTPITINAPSATLVLESQAESFEKDAGSYVATNYTLTAKLNGQTITIMEPTNLDSAVPTLLWAGDLNADGIPDALIDISNHYNRSNPALFLSTPGGKGPLLRKVAEFKTTGC